MYEDLLVSSHFLVLQGLIFPAGVDSVISVGGEKERLLAVDFKVAVLRAIVLSKKVLEKDRETVKKLDDEILNYVLFMKKIIASVMVYRNVKGRKVGAVGLGVILIHIIQVDD